MKWNKYLPFALIYFFVNSAGLPFGLTYTALLAPFFYYWVLLKRKKEVLLPFIGLLLPFVIAHFLIVGVDMKEYLITTLNILAIYIFGQAFYTWLKLDTNKETVLKPLLYINAALCFAAIAFYFLPGRDIFWIQQKFTSSVDDFLRLKMFTYEASYYALVFTPLFAYFFLQYIFVKNRINAAWLLVMLFLPFILSLSVGVIVSLILAGFILFFIHFGTLYQKRRIVNGFITAGFLYATSLAVLYFFFPQNPLFVRIENIFSGKDTSALGRTTNAFSIGLKMLEEKNIFWGIGPGQLKLVGTDIIRAYYLYMDNSPATIPNAAAETLALFGWVGFGLRIFIVVLLFFLTKTWTNYYRLLLYFFIFIYQFTGSYITNPAEYVIWILAFTPAFPEFNVRKKEAALPG